MRYFRSSNVSAQFALAERGSEVVPFVVARLKTDRDPSNIIDLLELLGKMRILKSYDAGSDSKVVGVARDAASQIGIEAIWSRAEWLVRFLEEPVAAITGGR